MRTGATSMNRALLFLCFVVAGGAVQTQRPKNAAPEIVKSMGVFTAPITIEVFSDFQCPACKTLYEQTLRPLTDDYVVKGKVYLVHRDFPLAVHAHAREAACYACAAGRLGKYEAACEVLFRQQAVWSVNGKVGDAVCSVLSPQEAKRVHELAKDPQVTASVDRDVQLGQGERINQTPTMVIAYKNQRYPISGAVSYDLLRRFLDQLLSK
jgi:protein-disulfide isomerase